MKAIAKAFSPSEIESNRLDPQVVRDRRGREIAATLAIRQVGQKWVVPSQSGDSDRVVDLVEEKCTCPDWELHRRPCKHLHAVYYWIAWGRDVCPETVTAAPAKPKRPNYPRNWPAYNNAQVNEGIYVERLLRALCDGIEQPPRKPGAGRNPIPLRDQAFAAVIKVYVGKSQRLVQSDLTDSVDKGLLSHRAHFNKISNFLGDEATTPLLISLIEESAKPLAVIENGQFAIDSTGFSTVTYDRWFDQKHGKLMAKHPWVKLHLMVGTVTHAITGVKVSDEGDSPQLRELLAQSKKNFDVREVSGDKAYSSKENHEVLESCGSEAFIPFKVNAVLDPKSKAWSRHLAEFLFNQEEFLSHYHRRSNAETVAGMIKAKFGAAVRSTTPVAQANEVLAKCLCHNLACLVTAIFAAGLAPKFWQDAPAKPVLSLVPPEPKSEMEE